MSDASAYERREFLHILKTSSPADAKEFIRLRQIRKPATQTFGQFMTEKIRRSGYSRQQIALMAGLSTDYTYKILNGGKRTDERDYIIAICMAAKMGYTDIQHALELYPFPTLDEADGRSEIIITCILNHLGIDDLNEILEKVGFPPLRVSPEMEKAEIGPVSVYHFVQNSEIGPDRSTSEDVKALHSERRLYTGGPNMRELDCRTSKERSGCGPFDFAYIGEIKVENDERQIKYVRIHISDEFTAFTVGNTSWYDEDQEEPDYDEYYGPDDAVDYYTEKHPEDEEMEGFDEYASIMEMAKESKYFRFFAKLDRLTDEMIEGRANDIPDTKYDGCDFGPTAKLLCGSSHLKRKPRSVMEMFNINQPEYNEYIQVMKDGDEYFYSASHMSCFTFLHLGDQIYHIEFGQDAPEPEYMFRVNSVDDVPEEYSYFKETFKGAKEFLDESVIGRGCTVTGVRT